MQEIIKGHSSYNIYDFYDGYIKCTCLNGRSFICDRADYETVKNHIWHITGNGYVKSGPGKKCIRLHRLLTGATAGYDVDHINGDPTDNRRSNLRVITHHQNAINVGLRCNSKTGYKGVCWTSREKMYRAYIFVKGKQKSLGYYSNPQEAALAYDKAASFYFGEFARLNFPGKEAEENARTEILDVEIHGGYQ